MPPPHPTPNTWGETIKTTVLRGGNLSAANDCFSQPRTKDGGTFVLTVFTDYLTYLHTSQPTIPLSLPSLLLFSPFFFSSFLASLLGGGLPRCDESFLQHVFPFHRSNTLKRFVQHRHRFFTACSFGTLWSLHGEGAAAARSSRKARNARAHACNVNYLFLHSTSNHRHMP